MNSYSNMPPPRPDYALSVGRGGRPKGLSGLKLKIVAGIMLFSQVASTSVIPHLTGKNFDHMPTLTLSVICELVSWVALPIYAWLVACGYRHTHSVAQYFARLLALALVCEIPYDLVTFGRPWDLTSQNPVWALVLTVIVLVLLDRSRAIKQQGQACKGWFLSVVFVLAGILWALFLHLGTRQGLMPIGALLVIFAVIFYALDPKENTMMMFAGLVGALALVAPAVGVAFLHYRNETLGYQDRRAQWACYAIYPVELALGVIFIII